jgi:hypothetical protein
MALTDEIFQKHLNATKKTFKRQYSHFRPFDDPDRSDKTPNASHLIEENSNDEPLLSVNSNYNDKQLETSTLKISQPVDNNQPKQTQNRHKPNTNITPLNHELNTNITKIQHNHDTNPTQTEHEWDTKPDTNIDTNETQPAVVKINVNTIVGSQRKLLFYIYDLCKIQGAKITPPLNIESIHENASIEKGSIKTSLTRLIKKNFLIREEVKAGRSGWVIFRIPNPVYQELFNNDLSLSLTQTRHKLHTESNTKPNTTGSVVSSSYINNNTTTNLPEDFKQIDFSSLSEIGFDESHVIQIHREYTQKPELSLSAEIVQNSINALAFDLKYNNVANDLKRPPAVFLTYLLKKGQPYSSKTPEKVLTPREESMREYLLSQEKKHLKLLEMETTAKNFALQEWLGALPEEELFSFNPGNDIRPNGMPEKLYQVSKRKKALEFANEYFNTILWPKKRSQILSEGKLTDKVKG